MKRILIAHDGSKSSDKAFKKGLELAERFHSSVTVISVIPALYLTELMEMDRLRILESLTEETKKLMAKLSSKQKGLQIKTVIRQGNAADEIIKTARKLKAEVIITGSHGRHGAGKFFLGSVSSRVVDYAPCSVLVVR